MKNILFEKLYNNYYEDIYRYSLFLCHNREVAEEFTQETFTRAWLNIDKLQFHNNIKGWLINVVKHINLHYHNDYHKEQELLYKYSYLTNIYYLDQIHKMENYDLLRTLTESLSYEEIRLINLFYFKNYKIKTIAKQFKVTENVIKVRLYRIRKKMYNIAIKLE